MLVLPLPEALTEPLKRIIYQKEKKKGSRQVSVICTILNKGAKKESISKHPAIRVDELTRVAWCLLSQAVLCYGFALKKKLLMCSQQDSGLLTYNMLPQLSCSALHSNSCPQLLKIDLSPDNGCSWWPKCHCETLAI